MSVAQAPLPVSRGGVESELFSSTSDPDAFARALSYGLAGAQREAAGVTAAQLRLGGVLGAGLAYGLGLWAGSGSAEAAAAWLAAAIAGVAASLSSLLLYLIVFQFFQLVPLLQERILFCGSILALLFRVALASDSSASFSDTIVWPLRVIAAAGTVFIGLAALRGSGREMRFLGASGKDVLLGMQRVPLCGLPPAGIWALLGPYRHGNARDVPVESLALFARMPTGWRATPLLGVLLVVEGADALLAPSVVSATRATIQATASPVRPLLIAATVLSLLAIRMTYLALALPIADRPHLHLERPSGAALAFLGIVMLCDLLGLQIPALSQVACVGIIMALGVLIAADERLLGDDRPSDISEVDYSFVTPPQDARGERSDSRLRMETEMICMQREGGEEAAATPRQLLPPS